MNLILESFNEVLKNNEDLRKEILETGARSLSSEPLSLGSLHKNGNLLKIFERAKEMWSRSKDFEAIKKLFFVSYFMVYYKTLF